MSRVPVILARALWLRSSGWCHLPTCPPRVARRTVRPMHSLHVEPSMRFADMVIPTDSGKSADHSIATDVRLLPIARIVRTCARWASTMRTCARWASAFRLQHGHVPMQAVFTARTSVHRTVDVNACLPSCGRRERLSTVDKHSCLPHDSAHDSAHGSARRCAHARAKQPGTVCRHSPKHNAQARQTHEKTACAVVLRYRCFSTTFIIRCDAARGTEGAACSSYNATAHCAAM